jgi:hypothetical protein
MTTDYAQAGIPLDRPGVRTPARPSWTITGCGPTSVHRRGAHYTVRDLDASLPVSTVGSPPWPGPPILIGGGRRS